ncbi:hypothetical protein L1887_29433 [Cichorium endivia]|nr:hypothetical protein L1887_29433 [Cichorium endivia]
MLPPGTSQLEESDDLDYIIALEYMDHDVTYIVPWVEPMDVNSRSITTTSVTIRFQIQKDPSLGTDRVEPLDCLTRFHYCRHMGINHVALKIFKWERRLEKKNMKIVLGFLLETNQKNMKIV